MNLTTKYTNHTKTNGRVDSLLPAETLLCLPDGAYGAARLPARQSHFVYLVYFVV